MRTSTCACAKDFRVIQAKSEEYKRIKTILNKGTHPTFIGRTLVLKCTMNGGATIWQYHGEDIGVALVNPKYNVLMVLNVLPQHRNHGIGSAMLRYLQCNFARVLESAVPFFERNGYKAIGQMKTGKRLRTQIMVKASLIPLAGRVAKMLS